MSKENLETKGSCDEQNLAMVLEAIEIACYLIRKCATEINCKEGRNIAESMCRIMENIQKYPTEYSKLPNQINAFLNLIKDKQCPLPKRCVIVSTKLSELLSNLENAYKVINELKELQVE